MGPISMKHYRELLRHLKATMPVKNYLEIGIFRGETLLADPTPDVVVGVDPGFNIVTPFTGGKQVHFFRMPSDEFFEKRCWSRLGVGPVDLSFVDGMHWCEFALRDVLNSERVSAPDSVIVVHDIYPSNEAEAARDINHGRWMGDVFKIIPILDKYRPDMRSIVINDLYPSGVAIYTNLAPAEPIAHDTYRAMVNEMESLSFKRDFQTTVASRSVSIQSQEAQDFLASLNYAIPP